MIRVVSLFCGIGGWDMGLYDAAKDLGIDVQVVAAYDSWPKAVQVYNANLSLTAHSWHGHDIRGSEKLLEIVTHRPRVGSHTQEPYPTVAPMDGVFGSLTADAPRSYCGDTLRLALRGNSASASASAFEDDEVLGSVLSNSFHANEASKIVGCRNPSLLEMARAHSIPDSFDWCGATKTAKGKMIANSVPCGLSAGVSRAILHALAIARGIKVHSAAKRERVA